MAPLIAFEDLNARAYVYLLRIEVALRELVRRQLSRTLGDAWQKRLPGPFLAKIRDAQRDEEGKRRFGFLRLGPLYYLSFGELLEILQQQPARQALEPLGGAVILNELQNLLGPRNAIGHGRSVSQSGLAAIESVYRQLEIALGRSRLEALLADPDAGVWPETALPELRGWLTAVLESVLALVAPPPAPH